MTLDESFVPEVPNGLLRSRKTCKVLNMAPKKANQGHWKGCVEPRFHPGQGHHSSTVPHPPWQEPHSASYLLISTHHLLKNNSLSRHQGNSLPLGWADKARASSESLGGLYQPFEPEDKNPQFLSTCWCWEPTATATGKQNLKWNKQAAGTAATHL